MKARAIIVVVLLMVLGGLFLTGTAESHVCYPENRIGVRSQNFTPEIEKVGPQNPDYTSLEQFLTDGFTSSTLVIQKEFDSTHLAYFGARYYDPTTGRFTNPDPFMGHLTDPRSQSMYGYGFNNPFSFWDLFGFQSRRVDEDGNLLYKHEVVPYYSQKEIDEINESFFLQFYDRLTMGMMAQEKEQVIRLESMIKRAEASGDQKKVRQAITELVNFKVDQIKFDPTGCAGGIKRVGKQASKPASKILIRHIDDLIARLNKILKTDTAKSGMIPGSSAHKSQRWAEYQQRGGQWTYERWSKVYELNMLRAMKSNLATDAYHAKIGWGTREVAVDVEGVTRKIDIADVFTRRGIEYKTGYTTFNQEIQWEVFRDSILVEQGWNIEWVFQDQASKPLLDALKKAGIPYSFSP